MSEDSYLSLTRDVDAVQIPSGTPCTLPAGTQVHIHQELGGTFTVVAPSHGGLFRIQGKDADALGRTAPQQTETSGPFEIDHVWAKLRQCYDPEIPVNIVDLGLIYDVALEDDEAGKGKNISVKMTLTAPGCGMGPTIAADAEQRILTLPGVASANVQVVWDPVWNPSMISPAGREQLGME
jgi:probable FeS assembly SUF system protein SufT